MNPPKPGRYATIVLPTMVWPGIEDERMPLLRQTISSLWTATDYPFELIVVDNGETEDHTRYLTSEFAAGRIEHLVLNRHNTTANGATDIGVRLSQAEYIAYSANDLRYHRGWLRDCVRALEAMEGKGKFIAVSERGWHKGAKYELGTVEIDGEPWLVQNRGDTFNWVLRRKDYYEIGPLGWAHHQDGFQATRAFELGWRFLCAPRSKVDHLGTRNLLRGRGEDHRHYRPDKLTFAVENARKVGEAS